MDTRDHRMVYIELQIESTHREAEERKEVDEMALKVYIESLGCSKNLIDSELMLGILKKNGYEITTEQTTAHAIVVNTCGFIEAAKEESINQILKMGELKSNNLKTLIVAGCLGERYAEDLLEELPEVNAIVGTGDYESIVKVMNETLEGKRLFYVGNVDKTFDEDHKRVLTTPSHSAYLKISDGCDNLCTYCIIPKLRGKYRSRKMENILEEAKDLAKQGVKEVILIAQDTTRYGIDLYNEFRLPALLDELQKIEGIQWIRMLYSYPEMITKELISSMKNNSKVCKYLDIPIQHASDKVLKRMNRRTGNQQLRDLIENLRKEIPEIVLRTSLIVGFPGETEEDFELLTDFVKSQKFERLGVFTYSKEEDTPAFNLPDQLREDLKIQRQKKIMELQQGISLEKNQEKIHREMEVLIEEELEPGEYLGRSRGDAPEIDGGVYVTGSTPHKPGDIVKVRITGAMEYDLMGESVNEDELSK